MNFEFKNKISIRFKSVLSTDFEIESSNYLIKVINNYQNKIDLELKNKSMTISRNGKEIFNYDGSDAKEIGRGLNTQIIEYLGNKFEMNISKNEIMTGKETKGKIFTSKSIGFSSVILNYDDEIQDELAVYFVHRYWFISTG